MAPKMKKTAMGPPTAYASPMPRAIKRSKVRVEVATRGPKTGAKRSKTGAVSKAETIAVNPSRTRLLPPSVHLDEKTVRGNRETNPIFATDKVEPMPLADTFSTALGMEGALMATACDTLQAETTAGSDSSSTVAATPADSTPPSTQPASSQQVSQEADFSPATKTRVDERLLVVHVAKQLSASYAQHMIVDAFNRRAFELSLSVECNVETEEMAPPRSEPYVGMGDALAVDGWPLPLAVTALISAGPAPSMFADTSIECTSQFEREDHTPGVCWPILRAGSAPLLDHFHGYFECQEAAKCGMHALNNAIGFMFCTAKDLARACDAYLQDNPYELRGANAAPTGWYSSEVMAEALQSTVGWKCTLRWGLQPLHVDPTVLQAEHVVGAVVNLREKQHWVAIRYWEAEYWLLDSQVEPTKLSPLEYRLYIKRHRDAYPIFRVQCDDTRYLRATS
jgi:hypothetical protein